MVSVYQSQLFLQSCFSQLIGCWPVQASLREKLGVRCTLALWPACNNAGCVYTQKQTILIFLTNELLYRYGIPSITQELWAKLSSTQYAHHVSIYRSQGKPIFQYYVVCFQNRTLKMWFAKYMLYVEEIIFLKLSSEKI